MTLVEKLTLLTVCLWAMLTTEFVAGSQEISSSSTEIGQFFLRQDRPLNHRRVYGYEHFQTGSSSEEIRIDFKRNFISRYTTRGIPQQRKRERNRSSPVPIPAHVPAPVQVLAPLVYTDPCQPNPCQNDAKCLLKDGDLQCHCSKKYIGEFCETINPCLPNPCKNKGRCRISEKSFSCECERPYTGQICEMYISTKIGLKLTDLLMLSGIDAGTLMRTSIFFAPTDAALMNTPEGFLENLSSDRKALTDFIMRHTVPRCTYPATDILNMDKIVVPAELDNSCPHAISKLTKVQSQLNQVCGRVIDFDEYKGEGLIFIINKVLISPTKHIMEVLSTDPRFTGFFQHVQHLVHILRILDQEEVTVLVPTNSAINALPKDITGDRRKLRRVILYHIVIGHVCFPDVSAGDSKKYSKVVKYTETQDQVIFQSIRGNRFINDVRVIESDIVARNGVVHYIEHSLDPSYVNI